MLHSSSNPQPKNTDNRTMPEVADREPIAGEPGCTDADLNLAYNPRTQELQDVDSFKVFLKKNLRPMAPPADLLAAIYDRVDSIKAEEAG